MIEPWFNLSIKIDPKKAFEALTKRFIAFSKLKLI
jgi:hypothetical protein